MGLKEELAQLYRLQQLDREATRVESELAALDTGARAAKLAKQQRQAAQTAEEALHQAEGELKDRELTLQSAETERKEKWDRAYGGRVSDPKELTALERKIEELDRRKDRLEEESLALLERVEQVRAENQAAQQAAQQALRRARKLRAQYQERSAALQQTRRELSAQREALVAELPAPLYAQYEQMRERGGGVAVAAIVKGLCEHCHTRVAGSYVVQLRNPHRLLPCENCGCWLVLAQD